ncbi:BadF/BadG/BcrA/BcrD ATPase family protein [Microbacterium sp. NRRL B-14842]|uniref:BadF/BadG/BcrA/BcrD ATPase family protein n=1 Tax=Microbacterium sp. NRRL B-14842 TaxID=3162881 RepID=UPI003D2BA66C
MVNSFQRVYVLCSRFSFFPPDPRSADERDDRHRRPRQVPLPPRRARRDGRGALRDRSAGPRRGGRSGGGAHRDSPAARRCRAHRHARRGGGRRLVRPGGGRGTRRRARRTDRSARGRGVGRGHRHAGALDGAAGVLLIAGTGAVALGVDPSGARLVDGWGPELGDFGSGSWLGREALRAVLRAHDGLAAPTALTTALAAPVGPPSAVQAWLAADGALARRLATLAPLVLAAAADDDPVARGIVEEAVRLLAATTAAAAGPTADVALHGGLTDHDGFRAALARALEGSGRRVVPARGGAMDGGPAADPSPRPPP